MISNLSYEITPSLAEDQVWRRDIAPAIEPIPKNALDIWQWCFTEMFNNAIDHSGGSRIEVQITKTQASTEIRVVDDGVGIFRKIQAALGLQDERHAILELSKGKLTTDPEKHSGQGVFFTARLLDAFHILSGGISFSHEPDEDADWILEHERVQSGTAVFMELDNGATRIDEQVFSQYSSEDGCDFSKTVVPVRLALYGKEKLISRSQAKRVVARVDLFQTVIFDFAGVQTVGQAFADEIFRVFAKSHPRIQVHATNTSAGIRRMIETLPPAAG